MTLPSPDTLERERGKLYVTDAELVRLLAPPRMRRGKAADYCGATAKEFTAMVKDGIFPNCVEDTSHWSTDELNEAMRRATFTAEHRGFVYFMAMGGFIKIGHSEWPIARLSNLQCGLPIEIILLAKFPGALDDEAAVHRVCRRLHVRGEWFRETRGLLAYIEWLKRRLR